MENDAATKELRRVTEELDKVTKKLKRVSSVIERGQGERLTYSLAFAFLGIGTSVIFFSGNMLNQALNAHVEGIYGVLGGVVGVLAGIFIIIMPAIVGETKKKKGKIESDVEVTKRRS